MPKNESPTPNQDIPPDEDIVKNTSPEYYPLPPDMAEPPDNNIEGVGVYTRFKGSLSGFDVAFDYPHNWIFGEEQGTSESYQQVVVHGPRDKANTFTTTLLFRTMPTKLAGGYYDDLEALKGWRLKQHSRGQDLEVFKNTTVAFSQLEGVELEFQYRVSMKLAHLKQPLTTMKKHIFLIQTGDQLHELSFTADEENYTRYHSVFENAMNSLRLPGQS